MPGKQTIVSRGSPPVQHAGHSAAAVAQVTVVTAGELHPLCAKLLFARQCIRRASADAAWAAQAESELLAVSGLQIAVDFRIEADAVTDRKRGKVRPIHPDMIFDGIGRHPIRIHIGEEDAVETDPFLVLAAPCDRAVKNR